MFHFFTLCAYFYVIFHSMAHSKSTNEEKTVWETNMKCFVYKMEGWRSKFLVFCCRARKPTIRHRQMFKQKQMRYFSFRIYFISCFFSFRFCFAHIFCPEMKTESWNERWMNHTGQENNVAEIRFNYSTGNITELRLFNLFTWFRQRKKHADTKWRKEEKMSSKENE